MTLRSSRTFPGQSCSCSRSIAGSPSLTGVMPSSMAILRMKCSASRGMSSVLSRSGGRLMFTTLSRKYRSSRKRFWRTRS